MTYHLYGYLQLVCIIFPRNQQIMILSPNLYQYEKRTLKNKNKNNLEIGTVTWASDW
jgi:hypothetical protein